MTEMPKNGRRTLIEISPAMERWRQVDFPLSTSETNWTLNATVGQIARRPANTAGNRVQLALTSALDFLAVQIPGWQHQLQLHLHLHPADKTSKIQVSQWPIWQGCWGNCTATGDSLPQVLTNCQSNLLAVCQERVPGLRSGWISSLEMDSISIAHTKCGPGNARVQCSSFSFDIYNKQVEKKQRKATK